ncbi:MAG: hypothetical protein WCT24_01595 [Patescibacteria group bacterium]
MGTRIFQLVLICIPVGLFCYLLGVDIAPGGMREASLVAGGYSAFIDRLLPDERVSSVEITEAGGAYASLLDDPTYFSVHKPQTDFSEIEVEILYQSEGQPLIQTGPRLDVVSDSYALQPLVSETIESLGWSEIEEDGVRLLARNGDVSSVSEFLFDLPSRSRIGVLGYELTALYLLPNYASLGYSQTFDVSLRGYHKYVTYVKNESFDLDATYWDMNRTIGKDDAMVRVRNSAGEVWFEAPIEDDGNTTENQTPSSETISIHESGWPEGVYSVELVGTSDIFWRKFVTSERYMTFVSKIYIGDDVGYLGATKATRFYTSAKHLDLETYHADATQEVQLGSSRVAIVTSHEPVHAVIADAGVVAGYTAQGDVKIVGDGKFSFSRDSFFDPDPVQIGAETDVDALNVDYILTTVEDPTIEGEWSVALTTFSTEGIWDENGDAKFVLSMPAIQENGGTVKIHEIRIRFLKDPLNFWGVIRALRDLLPFGI